VELNIRNGHVFATAEVMLESNEAILAESGSMVLYDSAIEGAPTLHAAGGITAMFRRAAAGENVITTRYVARGRAGRLVLAPALPGDLAWIEIARGSIVVQSGAFVACEPGVSIDASWQGAKGLFTGVGLILVRATGEGHVLVGGFGGIRCVEVDGEFIVDNGHVVAFDGALTWSVSRFGRSWMTSLIGGEGLICRFLGKGRLWVSSRSAQSFGTLMSRVTR
jgi:uncharacterized protein (TIGR00266 family)